jgi:hypothetical protein
MKNELDQISITENIKKLALKLHWTAAIPVLLKTMATWWKLQHAVSIRR